MHDLAEAIVGDITPYCGISNEDKSMREEAAMRDMMAGLTTPSVSDEIMALWSEYEHGDSIESHIAHQLDKLEMIIQANTYEETYNMRLDSFFESTRNSFSHPEILAWAEEVRTRRGVRLNL